MFRSLHALGGEIVSPFAMRTKAMEIFPCKGYWVSWYLRP